AKVLDAVQQFPGSPFAGASLDDVTFAEGRLLLKRDPTVHVDLGEVVRSNGTLEAEARVEPGEKRKEWAMATHSAVFVEVRVDEALGTIRVTRVVSAIAAGRVVNPKTAGYQIVGGVVLGICMAPTDVKMLDHWLGRYMHTT